MIIIFFILILISLTGIIDGFMCYFYDLGCVPILNFNNSITIIYNKNISIPLISIGFVIILLLLLSFYIIKKKKNLSEEYEGLLDNKKDNFILLYISHFLSSWGDRMWQFVIPVILMIIFKNTFMPTAIYMLSIYLGNIIGMQFIGKWIDKSNRFYIQKITILVENFCIISSSLIITFLPSIININNINFQSYKTILIILLIILLSIVGEIMNNTQIISTEKDWIIVMSNKCNLEINDINTKMKRIDLFCKILAPAVISVFIDLFKNDQEKIFVAGIIICFWNLLSFPIELYLKSYVNSNFPELNHKNYIHKKEKKCDLTHIKLYYNHNIFYASISLSLLYMTVLSNGSIMTNYLQWRKISLTIIGLSRGLGALFGFIGTFLFTILNKKLRNEKKTGLISLWGFFILLFPILISFILFNNDRISDYTLIGLCIISRSMLWIFDLSIQKIMQYEIEEINRGKINSMHTTMFQIFTCFIGIFGIIFYKPEDFIYLIMISILSLGISSIIYTFWYKKNRLNNENLIKF